MITLLEAPKHLLAVRLTGDLTGADVDKLHLRKDEILKESDRISFYAEYEDSAGYTLESILNDLYKGLGQFGEIHRYYRAAVVADQSWIATLARIEGLFFSSIDIRIFSLDERDKAFAWASEQPEPLPVPDEPQPSIHFISTNNDNVLAFEVNGRLREKDIEQAVNVFKPFLEKEGKLNVLGKMSGYDGFDLLSVLNDDLIKLKYLSTTKVAKYAVIGPKPWMRNLLELFNSVIETEVRIFDTDEETQAWEWIDAEQSLLPE